MIVFTVTNKASGQVYVGHTRNNITEQWQKIINAAASENLDFPLYHEMRQLGPDQFSVDEYDYAETRNEAKEIEMEVIQRFNALSMKGYKTSSVVINKKKSTRKTSTKKEDRKLKKLFSYNSDSDPEIDDSLVLENSTQITEENENQSDTAETKNCTGSVGKPEPKKKQKNDSVSHKTEKIAKKEEPVSNSSFDVVSYTSVSTMVDSQIKSSHGNNRSLIETGPQELPDTIKNELDALQAAASALKAGDMEKAKTLTLIPDVIDNTSLINDQILPLHTSEVETDRPEAFLTPTQKQITEAIARHRTSVSQRSATDLQNKKEALKNTLVALMKKADALVQGKR